ncbi:MAG: HTH-type transcriptional repressor CarH [Acidobacteriota bacterium]
MEAEGRRSEARHTIGVVARRTGLRPDVIRVWERRYQAVRPMRSANRRRLYSDEDLERLSLLRRATAAGRPISRVADLPTDELRRLVEEDEAAIRRQKPPGSPTAAGRTDCGPFLMRALVAAERLDSSGLWRALEESLVELGPAAWLEGVFLPIVDEIGRRWEEGVLRVPEEHAATEVLQAFLVEWLARAQTPGELRGAPVVVVGAPAGQRHELGALWAAALAVLEGWNVVYVGADLPLEELAAAVRKRGADVLALSLVFPPRDPVLLQQLKNLRRWLGSRVAVVFGGRAAGSYEEAIRGIGGTIVETGAEWRAFLRSRGLAASLPESNGVSGSS